MNWPQGRARYLLGIGIVAAALMVGFALMLRGVRSRISEEEIEKRIIATIQSEARASFLVTGSLDITATTSIATTKRFLPGILDLNLGTSRAVVQVPGRAHYGFDVRVLKPEHIRRMGDTIEIDVPAPQLLSVDANLQELRVYTQKGWARTPASVDAVEREALRSIDQALAKQAASHIASAAQPRVNSAHALEAMLLPPLQALGIKKPHLRFRLGGGLIRE